MTRTRKRNPSVPSSGEERVAGKAPDREMLPVDVAFQRIKEMMYHHELVPGQKLLYQELAKKLNMSITPVIQALNRLQQLNIVYSERNKGYYVGESDPREADELFVAREALETTMVPVIMKNLTDEKIATVERALGEHIKAASAPEYRRMLLLKDTNFHLEIMRCAENRVMYNLCRMILEQIYLKYRPEYMLDDRIKEAAAEHRALLSALKDRDTKRYKGLLKRHIRNGRKHIVGSLWQGPTVEIT